MHILPWADISRPCFTYSACSSRGLARILCLKPSSEDMQERLKAGLLTVLFIAGKGR